MDLVARKSFAITNLFIIYFFLLACSLDTFMIEGKNVVFILFSVFTVAILLGIRPTIPHTIDESIFIVLFFLTLSFIINFWSAEESSFLYSVFYAVTYIIIISNVKSKATVEKFRRALFLILAGYFAFLLIGQIYVLLGFFKDPHISEGLVHGKFGTLYEAASGFRYYSLSSEPSLAAFVVITAMYVYLEAGHGPEARLKRKDLLIWIMSIYMIITFQSGYGVILLFAMLFFKLSLRNSMIVILAGILLAAITVWLKLPVAERIMNFFTSVNLRDIEGLKTIDSSASYRILPFYYYVKNIDLTDYHFYFGYGAGAGSEFLIPFLFKEPVLQFEGGFLPQFLYDYGFFLAVAFLIFIRREVLTKWFSFDFFLVLILLTNANFNTQVFWFVISTLALKKWYTMAPGSQRLRNQPKTSAMSTT